MNDAIAGKAPTHLWIVGILSFLWNAVGASNYAMAHIGGAKYLEESGYGPETIAWFATVPTWATAAWAFGVWGGLIGSILLLLRSRYAVWAFAASLAGVVVMTVNTFINPYPAEMSSPWAIAFEWTIKIVAVLLLWYAWTMRKRRVLR